MLKFVFSSAITCMHAYMLRELIGEVSVTVNDPSAGSPTDTVLRLDHSLEDWVYKTSPNQ